MTTGRLPLLLPLLLGFACGGGTAGVRPDEMSAQEHRREAQRERAVAEEHMAAHDAASQGYDPGVVGAPGPTLPFGLHLYDPAASHLEEAERHSAHALEHEAAARELERFEAAECGAVPVRERAACPILGPVTAIVDIPGGVRVRFRPGTDIAAVEARMRCHFAFARTRGFADATSCPLYVRGLHIQRAADGLSIDLTGPGDTAREIRHRARETAVPAPAAPVAERARGGR